MRFTDYVIPFLWLSASCNPGGYKVHNVPTDKPTCETACSNLKSLGCPEAEPAADGRSCEDFCKEVTTYQLFEYDINCVTYARNAGQLKVCNVRCK